MKRFWIVFGVIACLAVAAVLISGQLLRSLEVAVPDVGGVLHWQVAGAYPEERSDSALALITSGRPLVTREVVEALRRAATDSRINGLFMEIDYLPTDWAQVEELRDAVADFSVSGKPAVAWVSSAGNKEYALALAADRMAMPREGSLSIIGISAELSFLKGTLGKLGMEADFLHVGEYKSAPERMTREDPTQPNREMTTDLVDSRYQMLVEMIADGRDVKADRAAGWIDRGLFDAPLALAEGLVDTVFYQDEARDFYFVTDETTEMEDYVATTVGRRARRGTARVAVVNVSGIISEGESRRDRLQGRIAGSATIIDRLRTAAEDPEIGAVILRVDSPGGSALASDLIWHEVARTREVIPVLVSMAGLAASGGYFVSCGADSIFAEPGTLTGSIGVYAGKIDRHRFYEKIGVAREFVTRGDNALMFSDAGRFSEHERKILQGHLDDFYDRFLGRVADGRGMTIAGVDSVARGRVWTGEQAVGIGLVDGLGGFDRTLVAVRAMLDLDPEAPVSLVSYERKLSLLERLLVRSLRGSGSFAGMMDSPLTDALAILADDGWLATVSMLDGRPLAMMPLRIELH